MRGNKDLMTEFQDHIAWSSDNVRLHSRLFDGDQGHPALLCIPGLTRNGRDFEMLAARFAPRFRVATLSLRGRGESGYAPDPLTYVPLTYINDVQRMVAQMQLDRLVVIGTSLGGLVAMLLDQALPGRIAGLVLNDVGPEIEPAGLERVQSLIGKGGNWPTWLHAARDLRNRQGGIYPDWDMEDWLAHAKRLCRLSREGRIIWDYDAAIAAPLAMPHANESLDMWQALDVWRDRPILSVRGELSDIFSIATQQKMQERMPLLTTVTVPNVGHAPTLEEPESVAALEQFLAPFRN